mmetsp:Transcript_8992/g.18151  ORF Transcript_8992/g.18151 Transcript_8992/m.18151 type:complete len:212 (+) Transcript_8992:83-718(+)
MVVMKVNCFWVVEKLPSFWTTTTTIRTRRGALVSEEGPVKKKKKAKVQVQHYSLSLARRTPRLAKTVVIVVPTSSTTTRSFRTVASTMPVKKVQRRVEKRLLVVKRVRKRVGRKTTTTTILTRTTTVMMTMTMMMTVRGEQCGVLSKQRWRFGWCGSSTWEMPLPCCLLTPPPPPLCCGLRAVRREPFTPLPLPVLLLAMATVMAEAAVRQ